jgi:tetratricopeptide (TPR) repeat protein
MPEAGEKYGILITTYADTKSAFQIPPEAFEPLIYYGQEALKSGDFSQAAYIFEAVLALGEEREDALTATAYLGWGQALNGQEKYFEAYNIFQHVKALTGDSEILTSIEEAEQASIFGFGQLTDLTGQLTIYAALEDTLLINPTYGDSSSERCFYIEGEEECISTSVLELTSLAVGIDEEESRFLLFRSDRGRTRLPEEIEAIRPGHFRYAAILVESQVKIDYCRMSHEYNYDRIQTFYSIIIYDTRTGELVASRDFKGLPPAVCLNRYTHLTKKIGWKLTGPPPSMDDIYAWFEEFVK